MRRLLIVAVFVGCATVTEPTTPRSRAELRDGRWYVWVPEGTCQGLLQGAYLPTAERAIEFCRAILGAIRRL
jgi:hypothetical protein